MISKFNSNSKTFEILYSGLAIKCLICHLISYNPKDVLNKYCNHCQIFHEVKNDKNNQ